MPKNETAKPRETDEAAAGQAKDVQAPPEEDTQVPSTEIPSEEIVKVPAKKASPKKPSDQIPNPFRPHHLTARIKKHAAAVGKKPEEIDPFQFLREHGLPNPVRLYRVTGTGKAETGGGKVEGEPMEIDAVDPTDAHNQYIAANGIKEAHGWHFQHAVLAE